MFCNKMNHPCYNLIILTFDEEVNRKVFLSNVKRFDFKWNIKINGEEVNIISIDFYRGDFVFALDLDDEEMKYPMIIEYSLSMEHIVKYWHRMYNMRYGEIEYINETWKSDGDNEFTLIESSYNDEIADHILKTQWMYEDHVAERKAIEQASYKPNNEDSIIDVDFVEIAGELEMKQ